MKDCNSNKVSELYFTTFSGIILNSKFRRMENISELYDYCAMKFANELFHTKALSDDFNTFLFGLYSTPSRTWYVQ